MADDGKNTGTDTSSIVSFPSERLTISLTSHQRPVSSLKDRFENLGLSNASAPRSTPGQGPSRLLPQFSGSPAIRSSLDQPRPLYGKPAQSQELWNQDIHRDGSIRQRERVGPRQPRPVSMGPTSPPTTPAVMVQSPHSPPKPIFPLPKVPSAGQSPPRPSSTGSAVRASVAPLTTSGIPAGLNGFSPTLGKKPKPPPPVNRASKPTLPPESSSLAPQPNDVDSGSVSPFSTPPDSPTSPEAPQLVGGYPRPPVRQGQTRRQPIPAPGRPQNPPHSSPFGPDDPSDTPERRPSLPVRTQLWEHARTISVSPAPHDTPRPDAFPHHAQSVRSPSRRTTPEPQKLHHSQSVRAPGRSQPPPRPSEASKDPRRPLTPQTQTFLPPPKRVSLINGGASPYSQAERAPSRALPDRNQGPDTFNRPVPAQQQIRRVGTDGSDRVASGGQESGASSSEYPDATRVNRRPPRTRIGVDHIFTGYDTRLFDISGTRVCSSGYITKAWNTENGRPINRELAAEETHFKILSMTFKPGANPDDEGQVVWLGSNQGDIQELDLRWERLLGTRKAHGRNEVIKMHRFQNTIWTLDSDARLFVWLPDESTGVPNLDISPNSHRVAKGHTFSIVAREKLWFATGKEIRVYDPVNGHEQYFHVTKQALYQPGTGEITSGAVLPSQLERVYFGHADGKVSIHSTEDYTCQAVINLSPFKITSMAGVGQYIWAGFGTGSILVYDTASTPWKVTKEWRAHDKTVASIIVNRSSVWRFGHLQVASIGLDNAIKLWDGILEEDWAEARMHDHDVEYCEFREIKAVVVTWNAGASKPADIRQNQRDSNFFREVVQPHDPPDIIVFGFQELVDLEDKGLTAKNFFKGRHKKQGHDPEHMGHQYRAWRDYLTRLLDETMPTNESYTLLQTGSLVGLFSCIFVKSSERKRIKDLEASEIKRGMGGLYGNKGAIMIRFVLDSTSMCFTNCHLAAGQKESNARNNDATAILETPALGMVRNSQHRMDCFVGGGDGTMILDHEICVLNGDLNYRIDTMGRDSVVKTINAGNLERLLERDQLQLAKRRNPAFRLRLFREDKITFAPTYKYDVGTDNYDSSEKNRSPAWCDRVLYRGQGRVKMIEYRRHECRASDHRPVSGTFLMRIKNVIPEQREHVWAQVQQELVGMRVRVMEEINADYLVNVLGLDPQDAKRRLSQ